MAGAAAGAYVLAQPVKRTMDFDTALRHAANTMCAGKSMNEKRAGMEEIKKSVMDAAYVGGTTPEAALEAMNTMVASGAMSGEAVKKLLPTVMKTAAAANAEGNDIANIITKALQAGFKEADSARDGGVRIKTMPLPANKWDLIPLPQSVAISAGRLFHRTHGAGYDWLGAIGVVLKSPHSKSRWFCSEWCAYVIGYTNPCRYSPQALYAAVSTKDRPSEKMEETK